MTSPYRRRTATTLTTASVISFSLTMLGGSIAVLSGLVPLKPLSFGERIDVGGRGYARIYFDSALGVGQEPEMALETGHQPDELVGIEVRRRSAAQVVLRHLAPVGQKLGDALHFDLEMRQVGLDHIVTWRRVGVTAAEPAALDAERNVRVDGKRQRAQTIGRGQRGAVVSVAVPGMKIHRRRIGCVARPDGVVAGE